MSSNQGSSKTLVVKIDLPFGYQSDEVLIGNGKVICHDKQSGKIQTQVFLQDIVSIEPYAERFPERVIIRTTDPFGGMSIPCGTAEVVHAITKALRAAMVSPS